MTYNAHPVVLKKSTGLAAMRTERRLLTHVDCVLGLATRGVAEGYADRVLRLRC